MKQENEKKLLADIENLRRKLYKKFDPEKNALRHCIQTYTLSCQLDKLIYQYMKTIYRCND
jgi:hypothetical protein